MSSWGLTHVVKFKGDIRLGQVGFRCVKPIFSEKDAPGVV